MYSTSTTHNIWKGISPLFWMLKDKYFRLFFYQRIVQCPDPWGFLSLSLPFSPASYSWNNFRERTCQQALFLIPEGTEVLPQMIVNTTIWKDLLSRRFHYFENLLKLHCSSEAENLCQPSVAVPYLRLSVYS